MLSKNGRSIDAAVGFRSVLENADLADVFRHRAAAIIDPFARSQATAALGNVSDGEESRPGTIAFSSNCGDAILVPDASFYQTRGYASYRAASESWRTDWAVREDTIIWRGTTTGVGQISGTQMSGDDAGLLQRTRMCLILRATPGVDVKFAGVAQSDDPECDRRRLQDAGILAGYVDPMTWLVRKFALDVDGNTNAWSNLFTRLLAGCCVIKIASLQGYRQWYYDELKPWQHFVPVKADLSDLSEKLDWCRMNDAECARIAASGRDFAVRRDFASEMKSAVDALNRRLGAK
ncbi:MAG: glycosyl transferase family 90 [Hyphomicrobiales bacterium]|nr:glycosyl transferase family 90 [Hyphomicrobiales bacterium]